MPIAFRRSFGRFVAIRKLDLWPANIVLSEYAKARILHLRALSFRLWGRVRARPQDLPVSPTNSAVDPVFCLINCQRSSVRSASSIIAFAAFGCAGGQKSGTFCSSVQPRTRGKPDDSIARQPPSSDITFS